MAIKIGTTDITNCYIGSNQVQKVYIGSTQVRPSGGGGWQPGANTIAYYPLTASTKGNDISGNNKNLTLSGTDTFENNYFKSNGSNGLYLADIGLSGKTQMTFSIWVYYPSTDSDFHVIFIIGPQTINNCIGMVIGRTEGIWTTNYGSQYKIPGTTTAGVWYNIIFTYDNGTWTHYLNNVSQGTRSQTITNTNLNTLYVGKNQSNGQYLISGSKLSDFIIEDKTRTPQEISDYYNLTKGNYGL